MTHRDVPTARIGESSCPARATGVCYLVGAGECADELRTLSRHPQDFVIAADGGFCACERAGILPDFLVGDFDSLAADTPVAVPVRRHPAHKDETDMMLAYRLGVCHGYTDFVLLGGTGGRADHTFANLQLLLYAARAGHTGVLVGAHAAYTARVVGAGTLQIKGKPGDGVSVFAFGSDASGVTLQGLEYPLTDGVLTAHFPLGVSNSMTQETAQITVKSGYLLVYHIPRAS